MVIDYMKNLIRDLHVFADGREVAQSCRMRLTARENLSLLPQLFHLEIENLSASSSVLLPSARSVEVRSGDSVLASGSPVSSCSRRRLGRSLFSLSFSPGMALWQSSVSLSLSAGMSVSDSVRAVLSASGTGIPLAAFSADDAFLTRPQSFFGRTCDALRMLADTVHAEAYLSSAGLCLIDHSRASAPTLILPEDALLPDPVFLPDRIILSTEPKGWPLGTVVRFTWQGQSCQGLLVSRLLSLDNVEGPWLSQLEVLPS